MSLTSTTTLRTSAMPEVQTLNPEAATVIQLSDNQQLENKEEKLSSCLTKFGKDSISRIQLFFEKMYDSDVIVKPDSQQFVRWQIVLSQCVLEGQRQEEVNRHHSPMEIAEFLQVGYFGAYSRAKKAGKPAFFDLWLKMATETIKPS